jgi:hypothetical protein
LQPGFCWLLLGYFLPLFSVDFLLTLVDFTFHRPAARSAAFAVTGAVTRACNAPYQPAPDMPLLLFHRWYSLACYSTKPFIQGGAAVHSLFTFVHIADRADLVRTGFSLRT